jgi:hypothetical protein
LRRPLSDEEVDAYLPLLAFATAGSATLPTDFYTAVETALRAFLQHPRFLYRVEQGQPVGDEPGVFALDSWDIATRLSYLLWGTTPSDVLLDLAAEDGLNTPDRVAAVARDMLADPRARARTDRFHALWFGYDTLPLAPELTHAMRAESAALVDRVVFDEQLPYKELFVADETYINEALAEHYGLAPPPAGTSAWIGYGDSGRAGLLSHGSYLASNTLGADTSPTIRGLMVRTRLLCQEIPPPPKNVNKDDLPESDSPCKKDVRAVYMTGACRGCHEQMDPIGWGLENYDIQGRYRDHEPEHPECAIGGDGTVDGVGDFNGPRGLAELLVQSEELKSCVTTQLYRFAMGRYQLDSTDRRFINYLVNNLDSVDSMRFDELVVAFVGSEAFGYRREEQPQ